MKVFAVIGAVVLGYLTYVASDMGEKEIAIGMGIGMVLCVLAAMSGSGKKSSDSGTSSSAGVKAGRRG